jgi:UDPglucose 6-dehydrogenase
MTISAVGMVGLGKLGLPCLLAMEKHAGVSAHGFEIDEASRSKIVDRKVDFWEAGVNDYLRESSINLVDQIEDLVALCDIIFVAVPTPHHEMYEGLTPLPEKRVDFDYSYLVSAISGIAKGLRNNPNKNPLIVVISTVLPGTMREKVIPILEDARRDFRFAYNPYFIAMGTTIFDFLNPEFILIGTDKTSDTNLLMNFYSFLDAKFMQMKIESAELTKVAYNTFIGFKIVFANAISEITERRGGDVDEVTNALGAANFRLMSPKYLSAGMGDGGGCHPRDQIAMSWLAQDANMSVDIFEFIAKARDLQTERQAQELVKVSRKHNLPILILGRAYKENSPLTVGSPAILLQYYVSKMGVLFETFDPWLDVKQFAPEMPVVAFIATKHADFKNFFLPNGSVVIDPWGFYESPNSSINVIYPGRNNLNEMKDK